jgi:hypothetical protein
MWMIMNGGEMNEYLDIFNFPSGSGNEERTLANSLEAILGVDGKDGMLPMLGRYRKALGDNLRREEWSAIFEKLMVLFKCGKNAQLDGPMIGVTVAIRDSDYFRQTAKLFGADRSAVANIEWMATCWNATFGPTGLWMGKTFEPVPKEVYCAKCGEKAVPAYDPVKSRMGRNFFREPADPNFIQGLGMPVLTEAWRLKERPIAPGAPGFEAEILATNMDKEKSIPYSKTGGYFIAQPGDSVTPEMQGKAVYQLNYRWPRLDPVYPMTRLVDEIVQIDDGVYLGQLVMATKHYSIGTLRLPLVPGVVCEIGEAYDPGHPCGLDRFLAIFGNGSAPDYGYQNNGFFLMIDTARARDAFADNSFPQLRPRPGEYGYAELGYDRAPTASAEQRTNAVQKEEWKKDGRLRDKYTTFCLELSPRGDDGDVRELLGEGESVLQMFQRIQGEITAATCMEDSLQHFEKLNRLFRAGIAPHVVDGLFQGQGAGYNTRFDAPEKLSWYGAEEPCLGFNYYHGATLNLHMGFSDTIFADMGERLKESPFLPTALIPLFQASSDGPNLLNSIWASIGRFIFPWAGKSFEKISGRRLSMLLDESDDLEERYPERVAELRSHLASFPHYDLVEKNREHYWRTEGPYAEHLKGGSWDKGMPQEEREFWERETDSRWVFGNNIQDSRILAADAAFRVLDMNYRSPIPSVQARADSGPSPFVRQGYSFLGVADRESILPMNNGMKQKKKVFQFHYRYPMIGGPLPIGLCLDELVEIAQGLFLGQLIYSTAPLEPFHSSVPPERYDYQLFGYFLLLDDDWERHRREIGFDIDAAT